MKAEIHADPKLGTAESAPATDDTVADLTPPAPSADGAKRGPDAVWLRPKAKRNYLLRADYRKVDLRELFTKGEAGARDYLAKVRWGAQGEGMQVCPACSRVNANYWCESVGRW